MNVVETLKRHFQAQDDVIVELHCVNSARVRVKNEDLERCRKVKDEIHSLLPGCKVSGRDDDMVVSLSPGRKSPAPNVRH